MNIVCRNWRAFERKTLCGFAGLEISDFGLLIKECTVHKKADRMWVGLPGRPQIDKAGAAIKDHATGKIQYTNVLQFVGRSFSDEFNTAAIAAIERAFPGALGSAPPAPAEYHSHRSAPANRHPAAGNTHFDDEIPF